MIFIQGRSPLQLTHTRGRHVPFRSKDDWDWKNHVNSGKAEENTRTPSAPVFVFLAQYTTLHRSRSIQLVALTQLKREGKGASRKPRACKELRIYLCDFAGRAGTSLLLLGFITHCLQGWLCRSRKPCSPWRAVPTPRAAATKERATTTHNAHVSHHRPIQLQQLPCNRLSPMVWTLQLATNVPTKSVNTLNLMHVVIDAVK